MAGITTEDAERWVRQEDENYASIEETINHVKKVHKPFWKCFQHA
jgi:hypothetical protein